VPDSNDNAGSPVGPQRRKSAGAAGRVGLAAQRAAIRAKARQRIAAAVAAGAVVVIVVIVLSLSGTHNNAAGTDARSNPAAASAKASTATASTTCAYSDAGHAAKDVGRPPAKGIAPGTYKGTITTNQGVVVVDLAGDKAPCTVNSFVYLATHKYFDGTSCHRLTTSGIFVLQCGDPSGTGAGGPGYQFADENLAGAKYPAGTVAMANAGPGTNGSQFFLVYKDTQLSPAYTPFGTVTSGLDVLNAIAAKGSDNANGPGDGKPTLPVHIDSVTVAGP
jgi:peptidyl-prolyl cis-trans isomerase B (cyclophilin B)